MYFTLFGPCLQGNNPVEWGSSTFFPSQRAQPVTLSTWHAPHMHCTGQDF